MDARIREEAQSVKASAPSATTESCTCSLCRKRGPQRTPAQRGAHTRWLRTHVEIVRRWEAELAHLREENAGQKLAVVEIARVLANSSARSSGIFETLLEETGRLAELWRRIHGLEAMLAERREWIGNAGGTYVPAAASTSAPVLSAQAPALAQVIPLFGKERRS